ncbi:BQ2448_2001 [Microbotryum intermedium]|uniref:Mitochondrial zinc maintenance protein 1, mitochondrial n=1 Tax=Microbotryum intermedium TaxID=269621 RepID=A0A238FA17_9BASI|nr:BQ2448_2001 [Microbotryum intermedium]
MSLMTPTQLTRAASAYRALLRAQRITFKGDDYALQKAHQQTRILFNKFLPSASALQQAGPSSERPSLSSTEIDEHIQSAHEIAAYLRKNVVQGIRNEEGNYTLRFTEETERGDNSTIKAPSASEARPLRPPREVPAENQGVRRRRRAQPKIDACCGGGGGGAGASGATTKTDTNDATP